MSRRLPGFLSGLARLGAQQTPRVDLHMHTDWTDGKNSVAEMYARGCEIGLENMLFSEHARSTSGDWFKDFAAQVRGLPQTPCRAWVGVEARACDLAGNINLGRDITGLCDLVVGSVHRFPDREGRAIPFDEMDPQKALDLEFRLALALLDNPEVHILGHPFGMCYAKYGLEPPKAMLKAVMAKAADTGVAFEINAKYHPDPRDMMNMCLEAGAFFSLGSDAHSTQELGRIVTALEGKL